MVIAGQLPESRVDFEGTQELGLDIGEHLYYVTAQFI